MSRDAKNSILVWIGTLAFFGVFWAAIYFEIRTPIPDNWLLPLFLILVGVNVVRFAWDFFYKRSR